MFSVYPSHVHTHFLSPSLSDRSKDSLINARRQSRGAQTDRFFDLLEQKYPKKQSKAGGGKNKGSSGKVTWEKKVCHLLIFAVVLDSIVCLHAPVQTVILQK